MVPYEPVRYVVGDVMGNTIKIALEHLTGIPKKGICVRHVRYHTYQQLIPFVKGSFGWSLCLPWNKYREMG